jgi:hypothetical protein
MNNKRKKKKKEVFSLIYSLSLALFLCGAEDQSRALYKLGKCCDSELYPEPSYFNAFLISCRQ